MGVDVKRRRGVSTSEIRQVKQIKPNKGKPKFSVFSFLIMFSMTVVLGFFVFSIAKSVIDSVELYNNNLVLESKINGLYYEKEVLLEQQENFLSDAQIELLAKDKLGLIKPGEVVYVLENIN